MNVGELFVVLGLKSEKAGWAQGMALIYGLTRAAQGLVDLVSGAADVGINLSKMSQQMGLSVQSTQEWGYVAQQSGANMQQLGTAIGMFEKSMLMISQGSGSKQIKAALGQLGITSSDISDGLKKPDGLNALLYKAADALQKMGNTGERAALMQELFGRRSAGAAVALAQGGDALKKWIEHYREMGIELSETDVGNLKGLKNGINDLKDVFNGLINQSIAKTAPALNKALESMTKFLVKHREQIEHFLVRTIETLIKAFDMLGEAVNWFVDQGEQLLGHWGFQAAAITALVVLFGSLALAATAAAVATIAEWVIAEAPFIAIAVLVIALAVYIGVVLGVIQDLWIGMNGGHSVIMDLSKAFMDWLELTHPKLWAFLETFGDLVGYGWDLLGYIRDASKELDKLLDKLGEVGSILKGMRHLALGALGAKIFGESDDDEENDAKGPMPLGVMQRAWEASHPGGGGHTMGDAMHIMEHPGLQKHGYELMNDSIKNGGIENQGSRNIIVQGGQHITIHIPPGVNAEEYVKGALKATAGKLVAASLPGGAVRK